MKGGVTIRKFRVSGCIQGYGMDADKFYNTVEDYEADTMEEAQKKAEKDGIWVERIEEVPRE